MKVAVLGAGFSGLALAYHLAKDGHSVTIFDAKGIGSGASGVASGLMHPYPGKAGKLSWRAEDGMEATKRLLKVAEKELGKPVCKENGILRVDRLVPEGITVHSMLYITGLFKACEKLGVTLQIKQVESLDELDEFDLKILAVGAGIKKFYELDVKFVKGQLLKCKTPHFTRSMIGNGYIAVSETDGINYLGSTYEHNFENSTPCLKTATKLIMPRIETFLPACTDYEVLECKSGVRVSGKASYTPIVEKKDDKTWVVSGMGSRGLLYHALMAEDLVGSLNA